MESPTLKSRSRSSSVSSSSSSPSSSSSLSSLSLHEDESKGKGPLVTADDDTATLVETRMPIMPGIEPAGGNRIRVRTASGRVYEADRYCPHKHVDLLSKGRVAGETLICTKHDWHFDLCSGGNCGRKGRTVNACLINDW
ncbi:hypothetical protein THASP1DRAFT_33409 [Thamnocephalis sphaerospora]|uniref:Rieske domain-containing protein n=1 Tax=Thamnocephalis sphaerospora TaxID=78915 RepID=A0A4P9XGL9_9FUNG|nr:hypothetical protein THASP1DRAFT_33409 [Thamnocephalis sphaerospora]|eukprot:RKP04786.1 hypothetical protein THASP1DRAFT_33409 [Thamnocephalis sphaerospora]